MNWTEIIDHVDNNRLEVFGRDKVGEETYQAELANLRSTYGSVSIYLRSVKLQQLKEENQALGKYVISEPINSSTFKAPKHYQLSTTSNHTQTIESIEEENNLALRPRVLFVENDFGYHVESPIKHHLIWSLTEWNNPNQIQAFLDVNLPFCDHTFFVNPPHLQSIKDIFHIHVFSKPWTN